MPDAAGETRIQAPESRRGAATDLPTRATCRLGHVAGSATRQVAAPRPSRGKRNAEIWLRARRVGPAGAGRVGVYKMASNKMAVDSSALNSSSRRFSQSSQICPRSKKPTYVWVLNLRSPQESHLAQETMKGRMIPINAKKKELRDNILLVFISW